MEVDKDLQEKTGNLIKYKSEIPIYLFLFSAVISIIFGGLSGWYFTRDTQREIVVLDVAKIIEGKKKEFIEKYKDREPSPTLKKEMEADISAFTANLNQIIQEQSKGRIVFIKDSVVSEIGDITDEVEKRVRNIQ